MLSDYNESGEEEEEINNNNWIYTHNKELLIKMKIVKYGKDWKEKFEEI